ncbi:MAG: type II toxin-antitoxin system PemK/MazF family toxin [Rhodoferax sp.]
MSQPILRGDVYLVDFDPPKGEEYKVGSEILKRRPAVVISHNAINRARRTVMVVPLSTAPTPVEIFAVPVPSAGADSVAVCDQVTTINKATRLLHRIGQLSRSDFKGVESGVKEALGLGL